MENAVDALKIAFAVLLFTMSLSLAIFMFSQARETADVVLHSSDITEYMEYIQVDEMSGTESRVVGLETIIPTLYKYYKENYTVIFRDSTGYKLLYETKTNQAGWSAGYTNKYYVGETKARYVCSFDVDEETKRHEPWTGDAEANKYMIDCFISGEPYKYKDSLSGEDEEHKIEFLNGDGLKKYSNAKFMENLGEYTYNASNEENKDDLNAGLLNNRKKRVIIYTLLN